MKLHVESLGALPGTDLPNEKNYEERCKIYTSIDLPVSSY